ncbi:MAG: GspE/PulE family protein [Gammaproteobacteria bacterium]|nr:MAG: GspE/PulE family protein [Gammaproteobacteria bacterium]
MFNQDVAIQTQSQHKLSLEEILGDLISDGLLLQEDADAVIAHLHPEDRVKHHPLENVANQQLIDRRSPNNQLSIEVLTVWLADKSGVPYKRIDPLKVDVTMVTEVVSYAYAERHKILPVEASPTRVVFATCEPYLSEWQPELENILKKTVERVVVNPVDIERYRVEFYGVSRSVKGAVGTAETTKFFNVQNIESLVELGRRGHLDSDDQHIVNIVDWLLQYAFEQRASDIHLEPRREMGNVRFRIDGVMNQVYQVPATVMTAVVSRIKSLGRMNVAEKRKPQDGRVKSRTPNGIEIEMRLSTMPTAFGEKLVMRIFDPNVLMKSLKDLGFGRDDEKHWKKMVSHTNGIILVTGPTGSGKTTTLYSTMKSLAKPEVNVCTVEEPIEMVEPSFNQMQVQQNIGVDFASGIRTLMRQDPDIIMVGEIRDLETAEMAIQASLTGHLVLSTLHTNDSTSAITRLLDIGVPYYLIKATLLGVVAQRLVRTLCPHCKQSVEVDEEMWNKLVSPWTVPLPTHAAEPVGCLECRNTGYMGRIGLYEAFTISADIQSLIREDFNEVQTRKQAYKDGMLPLRLNGAQKVNAGLTTLDEVLRVVPMRMD